MWRKGNPIALLVGMQTSVATVETVWNVLKKLKMKVHFNPVSPCWKYNFSSQKHQFKRTYAPLCSQ